MKNLIIFLINFLATIKTWWQEFNGDLLVKDGYIECFMELDNNPVVIKFSLLDQTDLRYIRSSIDNKSVRQLRKDELYKFVRKFSFNKKFANFIGINPDKKDAGKIIFADKYLRLGFIEVNETALEKNIMNMLRGINCAKKSKQPEKAFLTRGYYGLAIL